jgi:hypothetical protein
MPACVRYSLHARVTSAADALCRCCHASAGASREAALSGVDLHGALVKGARRARHESHAVCRQR